MSARGLKAVTTRPGCGYGDAACAYLAALAALGIPVCWEPLAGEPGQPASREQVLDDVCDSLRPDMDSLWRAPVDYDTLLVSLPPIRQFEHYLRTESVAASYCSVTWELEQLPPDWAPVLNRFDGVLVPSRFNARVFKDSGVTVPVTVIPHFARELRPASTPPEWLAPLEGLYMFYTIGTWTTRKAMEDTIRAYLEAFSASDDVCLVIKTEDVNQTTPPPVRGGRGSTAHRMTWFALARILADYPRPARVHLVTEHLLPEGIDCLHARGDCFLSLTHSEGWGLGAFDAVQAGNPVIITGFGGQLDFLGEDYPLLVRYELEQLALSPQDGYFRDLQDQCWARASRCHAGELMRQVYADAAGFADLGRRMQSAVQAQFSARRLAPALAGALGLA